MNFQKILPHGWIFFRLRNWLQFAAIFTCYMCFRNLFLLSYFNIDGFGFKYSFVVSLLLYFLGFALSLTGMNSLSHIIILYLLHMFFFRHFNDLRDIIYIPRIVGGPIRLELLRPCILWLLAICGGLTLVRNICHLIKLNLTIF